ncbi:hypothetical protein IA539_11145 [Gordonia sp. zg691]|uniref:hypothetical protein n=1 Tax=Gordonia jinghuaiqii TaxID=2758710 RepID=UPI00166245E0|nr:hypothetical protein [Gordonia jinghuaiqii]MBD0861762.1 hypothetical protein [Gordonia jinghuaiqii]
MNDRTIFIVDEVVLKAGAARDFVAAYLDEYAPAAQRRGLTLDRVIVTPPIWLDDDSNTVTATWSVPGTRAWWQTMIVARHDPSPSQWWADMAPLIVERSRSMAADVGDVDGLCMAEGLDVVEGLDDV